MNSWPTAKSLWKGSVSPPSLHAHYRHFNATTHRMVHFMHLFSPWQNTNLLCPFGLTKTFTCVQLSNTYLSATLTTATFPTAAACRGFDASACTPTPRDLLSSHWQLRLHLIWKVANPLYIDVHLVAHGQVHWFTL